MQVTATSEKLHISITQSRVEDLVTVDEFIGIQQMNLQVTKKVLARFVIDPETEDYMTESRALELIGKLTIGQLKNILGKFTGDVEEAVVPLPNEPASG